MNCTKAIIMTGGYGTRRLPITKAIEKCMLPICNRPTVDYSVEDCVRAGIQEIILVVNEENEQVRTYYSRNRPLEQYLRAKGKDEQLAEIMQTARKATFHFVIQDRNQPYGTAVPVALCKQLVQDDEQVVVIGGDDFIYNADGSSEIARMLRAVEHAGATAGMLAVQVPKDQVFRYGVIDIDANGDHPIFKRIVEKPSIQDAPSNLINISKYLFDKKCLAAVDQVMASHPVAGEYQITDVLNAYKQQGSDVVVVPATGEYLDGGTLEGWLHANQRVFAT